MKLLKGFVLSFILVSSQLLSHFFAYKELINPATGQIIELYYDMHQTDNSGINPYQQQKQLLDRAKKYNCMIITEDMESFYAYERGDLDSMNNHQLIDMVGPDSLCPSPLSFLCTRCLLQDIEFYNAECRQHNDAAPLAQKYQDELDNFDDGNILNNFYDNQAAYAQQLDLTHDHSDTNFFLASLTLDARIVHAIYTTPHKHIMIAAGASHIIRVQGILKELGWESKKVAIPQELSQLDRTNLVEALKAHSGDTPVDASFRWGHYLNENLDAITHVGLDLTKLPTDNLANYTPQIALPSFWPADYY